MSFHDQAQRLMEQGAAMRLETYAAAAVMQDIESDSGDHSFACYWSPISEARKLEAATGYKSDVDLTLRVAKTETNFNPTIGKNVVLIAAEQGGTDMLVRLVRPRVHPLNPEYVFECRSLF